MDAMGMEAEQDNVKFPYDQALALARRLWKVGSNVGGSYKDGRLAAAKKALEGWEGRFAQTFAHNTNVSLNQAGDLEATFHAAAEGLAKQWVEAHTEQQRRDWACDVQEKRNHRSWGTKVWDGVAGDHTNYGSPPTPPATPQPPEFAPTPVPKAHA